MSKAKAYYLIPDQQMLRPNSGPSEHINIGLTYLGKEFELEKLVLGRKYEQGEASEQKANKAQQVAFAKNGLIGMLRDVKRLLVNHRDFFTCYQALKKGRPDFVFERAEYLNYNGIIACKLLKIPHFYEVNWVFFREIRQFYHSCFNPIAKRLEEWAYNSSHRGFFVGNQNKFLKLKHQNWEVIQNGIPLATAELYTNRTTKVEDKIHCAVVAKLMPHHRFDILVDALKQLKHPEAFHFHFIGYEFEEALKLLGDNIAYTYHGPVPKKDLPAQLAQYQLGVISGGMHYASFMKLYEYAAVKLMVICPELENLVNNFEADEICFFTNESAEALAEKLDEVSTNPAIISTFANALHEKVKRDYSWENIFGNISQKIKEAIATKSGKKERISINS